MPGVVLHNEAQAPPALLASWLAGRGIDHEVRRVWEEGVPADPREYEWIAALGSPCSVNDREPEWIPAEIDFLRRATEAEVPVLGICFGGQALSAALGGEVGPADPISIGWHGIETAEPDLVPPGPWLHFNFECLSVPPGAIPVARSPCGPGAFRAGPHLGLQFHPEVTPEIAAGWAAKRAERLARLGISAEEISAAGERFAEPAARAAHAMFDAWWRLRGAASARERSAPP